MDKNSYGDPINIVDGPSIDQLLEAFKYAYLKDREHHSAEFITDSGERVNIFPIMLQHEDGSGHSFWGKGFVNVGNVFHHDVCFYFHESSRTGYIKYRIREY